MKSLALGILIALLISNSKTALAFDDWSKTDIALQTVYTTLHIIDWAQTLEIASNKTYYTTKVYNGVVYHPSSYTQSEGNILLGRHPSKTNVNIYFASTLLAHTVVSCVLPSTWRKVWQVTGISVEAYATSSNFRAGISGFF